MAKRAKESIRCILTASTFLLAVFLYGCSGEKPVYVRDIRIRGVITDEAKKYLRDLEYMDESQVKYLKEIHFVPELEKEYKGKAERNGVLYLVSTDYDSLRLKHELYHLEDYNACKGKDCSESEDFIHAVTEEWESLGLSEYQKSNRLEIYAGIRLKYDDDRREFKKQCPLTAEFLDNIDREKGLE